MKKILIAIIALTVVFLAGCEVDISKVSDEDIDKITESAIACNSPYIRFGTGCCLDQNNNSICDEDETIEEEKEFLCEEPYVANTDINGNLVCVKSREVIPEEEGSTGINCSDYDQLPGKVTIYVYEDGNPALTKGYGIEVSNEDDISPVQMKEFGTGTIAVFCVRDRSTYDISISKIGYETKTTKISTYNILDQNQSIYLQKASEEEVREEPKEEGCTEHWACVNNTHRGKQLEDCSWDYVVYCKWGCQYGNCQSS